MDYRLGTPDDLDEVVSLVEGAKRLMSAQGINQWDDIYPCREDFENDIKKSNLYVVLQEEKIAAVYVISEECDEEYKNGKWEYEKPCIIHRLCVSPDFQHRGIGNAVLAGIEAQLLEMGYKSVRLDVFTQNPFALRLYQKNGYLERGHADWRKGRFLLMEKRL